MKAKDNQIDTNNVKNGNLLFIENNNKQVISGNLRMINNKTPCDNNMNLIGDKEKIDKKIDNPIISFNQQISQDNQIKNNVNLNKSRLLDRTTVNSENIELINRLYEDVYKNQSDNTLVSINKYTYNVRKTNKIEDVIKIMNDKEVSIEKKKSLYFKLKAGIN